MILSFEVNNQEIKRTDHEVPVSDTVNVISACFTFNEDWDDFDKKIVIFTDGDEHYKILLEDPETINGKDYYVCVVPYRVCANNKIILSCYGVHDDVRLTTKTCVVRQKLSGYVEDVSPLEYPEKDIFTIIFDELNVKFDNVQFEDNNLNFYSKGKLLKSVELIEEEPLFVNSPAYNITDDDIERWNNGESSYSYIKTVKDYLYEIFYDELDYDYAYKHFQEEHNHSVGACSSVRKGDFYGRNFDWVYSEEAEFIVQTSKKGKRHSTIGVGFVDGLTNQIVKNKEYSSHYKILPFLVADAMNEKGLVINTNVVPQDKGITTKTVPLVEERHCINMLMLPRFCVDNFATATECVEYLKNYVSLTISPSLVQKGYEQHFMIGDLSGVTYSLEIIENEIKIKDISSKPYLTNFHIEDVLFNITGNVYTPATQDETHNAYDTNKITINGQGLERYNLINNEYNSIYSRERLRQLLLNLNYTKSYDISNGWYTEFTGINNLNVKSSPQEFEPLIEHYYSIFRNRSRTKGDRNYGTWQTNHSSIYDLKNKKLYIIVQEDNEEIEYDFDIYYTAQETDELFVDNDEYEVGLEDLMSKLARKIYTI